MATDAGSSLDGGSEGDAGATADAGGTVDAGGLREAGTRPYCSDGIVTDPETCDTAIPATQVGACPGSEESAAMSDGCEYTYGLLDQGPCFQYCEVYSTCP